MKKFLKGYSPGVKIVSGALIATTIIAGGYLVFKRIDNKPVTSVKPPTTSSTKTTTTPQPKATNYNGAYAATAEVAYGISSINVNVSGSNLTGKAIYSGPYGSKVNLNVQGTVDSTGKISGTFSGNGSAAGQSIAVNGVYSGHIINTSMNVSYSATALGQSFPGSITLSKQ